MRSGDFREAFEQAAEQEFDVYWKSFVKNLKRNNLRSNERLFKVLKKTNGQLFVADLKNLSRVTGDGLIRISQQPIGIKIKEKRWSSFPVIWVNQTSTDDGIAGTIYVQINEKKWAYVRFYP